MRQLHGLFAYFTVCLFWLIILISIPYCQAQNYQTSEQKIKQAAFGVDDIEGMRAKLVAKGAIDESATVRDGLQNWRVIDLNPDAVFGATIHLTEER